MIIKKENRIFEVKNNLKDGDGSIAFTSIALKNQTYDKIKMYSTLLLKKNDSIGYHTHNGEKEIMLINKGKGLYKDDGLETTVYSGDVTICEEGHFHGIKNESDEDLEIIAMIIEKNA